MWSIVRFTRKRGTKEERMGDSKDRGDGNADGKDILRRNSKI